MASTAVEETGGVGSARQSRERQGLRESGIKSEMTHDELLFIGSKISTAVLN
jgi:hypothetical protein